MIKNAMQQSSDYTKHGILENGNPYGNEMNQITQQQISQKI